MNEITRGQLAAMLLITDAFALFCFTGSISLITAAGLLAGILLQLLLSAPLVKLGGIKEKSALIFYLVYLIMWGGLLLGMQWKTSQHIYIPYENSAGIWGKLLISGVIALVCLYISSAGIKAMGRASVIAAFIGAVCILIAAVSGIVHMNIENFSRAESGRTLTEELITGFALSGGTGSLAILLGITKGNSTKNVVTYFTGKAILTAVVTFTAIIVAGGIMEITDFPVVTAAQVSQPFSSQRIDSLFLIVFAIFAVFSIAVQTTASAYIFGKLFPKFVRFRSSVSLLLIIGAAFLLWKVPLNSGIIGAGALAALSVVPLVVLICKSVFSQKGRA